MRRSSFRVIFGTDASSDPRRLKFVQTKRLKATIRYGYGDKYMIQDSHVVALHISLRCVEVAACAGHVWVSGQSCNTTSTGDRGVS